MICDKYKNLSPREKIIFIGEVIHAVQSSDTFFNMAEDLIKMARKDGLFDGVIINPPRENTQENE